MSPMEKDDELKIIIEHAKALKNECTTFNKSHDHKIRLINLFVETIGIPIGFNIENMPKDDIELVQYDQTIYCSKDINGVRFYEIQEEENNG